MRPCNTDVHYALPDYDVNRRDADVPLLGRLFQLHRSVCRSLRDSFHRIPRLLSVVNVSVAQRTLKWPPEKVACSRIVNRLFPRPLHPILWRWLHIRPARSTRHQ